MVSIVLVVVVDGVTVCIVVAGADVVIVIWFLEFH